jgi:hypothetical protein
MTTMMLTALNANTGDVLDLTAMTAEQRDLVHGVRTAQRSGFDIICRQCEHRVGLVRNHHRTEFWRHAPLAGRACILSEFHQSESPEHFGAKVTIATALRDLTGWVVDPERPFGVDGDIAVIDVYAHHINPAPHQLPVAWEVQLSHQTRGTFVERTTRIARAAGAYASWVTPFDQQLGGIQGIVTDARAEMVVGRIYTEPDESSAPLPPMPLAEFVKAVSRKHRRLMWSASGEDDRFIAYPIEAVERVPRRHPSAPGTLTPDDRACDRALVARPVAAALPFAPRDYPIRETAGDACERCGTSTDGIKRLLSFGFTPHPCHLCRDRFSALIRGS